MGPTVRRTVDAEEGLQLVAEIRSLVPRHRSALIAITGIDSCGKGYLASRWSQQLQKRGLRVAVIGVDGWLNLPRARFGGTDPADHFYLHALRFAEMFSQLVLPLKNQRSIHVEADFTEEAAAAYRREIYQFDQVDVILLEGNLFVETCFSRPL